MGGLCCSTCCGLFPRDPDKYTLTASGLRLDEYDIPRICGIWKCMCAGGNLRVDNIALDQIRDVDTLVVKSGFCCFSVNKSHVVVAVGAGNEAESDEARVVTKDLCMEEIKEMTLQTLFLWRWRTTRLHSELPHGSEGSECERHV